MLADRIRMCVNLLSKKDDPLCSVGPQDLILGDMSAGYFGTVTNLITNTQLTNLMSMTAGTLLDPDNTDIVFHKFAHRGRILLIPSRPIRYNIGWDSIQSQDGVKGRVITIDGREYLCRLMTGSRHYYTSNASVAGGEWEDLFVKFHISKGGVLTDEDIYTKYEQYVGAMRFMQEVHSFGIGTRVVRGNRGVNEFGYSPSNQVNESRGWLPILEVL